MLQLQPLQLLQLLQTGLQQLLLLLLQLLQLLLLLQRLQRLQSRAGESLATEHSRRNHRPRVRRSERPISPYLLGPPRNSFTLLPSSSSWGPCSAS